MTETPTEPQPDSDPGGLVIKRGLAGLFSIWLVPVIALIIGGWLIYQTLSSKGPTVTISFATADGIEAGKTRVKYKDVTVGTVDDLILKPDLSGVELTVEMAAGAENYLTENTRFWVVRPRVSLQGVSGLDTLVSGSYIEVDPGEPGKESIRDFVGLEDPPALRSGRTGKEFTLNSTKLGSYSVGSPVYYRGFEAGEILSYELAADQRSIVTRIFVNAPYDALVSEGSRFWDTSGISLSLTADGMELEASSLQSLMMGGIEFSTPENLLGRRPAPNGHRFTLFDDKEDILESEYTEKYAYILYFRGSVRGLSIGAPVEFKGIRIGTVTDINLEINPENGDFFIPVLVELEPQRIKLTGRPDDDGRGLQQQVERGLRAQLKTGSFLTGQLFVDLVFAPEKEPVYVARREDSIPEIPTIATNLEEITTSVTQLVDKIEKLPIEQLSGSLLRTAEGVEQLVTSEEIQNTVSNLNRTLVEYRKLAETAQDLTDNLDQTIVPEAAAALMDARQTLQQTEKTIVMAQALFGSANSMLSEGSPLRYDLEVMLRELAASARSIRNLSAYLERNPSALITGKTTQGISQ